MFVWKTSWWLKSEITWIALPVCIFRSFYRTHRNIRYELKKNAVLQTFWNIHGFGAFDSDLVCLVQTISYLVYLLCLFHAGFCAEELLLSLNFINFISTTLLSDVVWCWECLNLTINASIKEMDRNEGWDAGERVGFLLEYPWFFFFRVFFFVLGLLYLNSNFYSGYNDI